MNVDPDLAFRLDIATPKPGDWALYCPFCNFIGGTNAAMNPYQHNPQCSAGLNRWGHTDIAILKRALADRDHAALVRWTEEYVTRVKFEGRWPRDLTLAHLISFEDAARPQLLEALHKARKAL